MRKFGKRRGRAQDGGRPGAWRALEVGLKGMCGILKVGGMLRTLKIAMKGAGDGTSDVERLVARMWFDPELASHLLTRKTQEIGSPAWNSKLNKILIFTQMGRSVQESEDE